jgi:2'-5' RNA ligase
VQLDFTRIEYWTEPKVVVAMPVEAPASGQQLVDRLWLGLEPLGFARERRPWRPHLTVARQVRRPPPDGLVMGPLAGPGPEPPWRLALVESSAHPDGPRYKPLADWPLEGVA